MKNKNVRLLRRERGANAVLLGPMYLFTVSFLVGPFVYMIVLSFLSGLFLPVSGFPEGIRPFATALPPARALSFLEEFVHGRVSLQGPLLSVLLYSLIFLLAAAALRTRRLSA